MEFRLTTAPGREARQREGGGCEPSLQTQGEYTIAYSKPRVQDEERKGGGEGGRDMAGKRLHQQVHIFQS